MKKLLILSTIFMVSIGMVAAQGQAPDQTNPQDQRPDNAVIPELPSDASPIAKQVRTTINNAFSNGIQGLGEALNNLLGNGNAGNLTEDGGSN